MTRRARCSPRSRSTQFLRLHTNAGVHVVRFAPVALTAGAVYRLSLTPGPATVQVRTFSVPSNAHLGGFEGGSSWYYSQRTDAGAWTDTTTKRPWFGVHVASIAPASGGGETAHVFVSG